MKRGSPCGAVTVLAVGLIASLALAPFVTWGLTLVAGWGAAALHVNSMGPATRLHAGELKWG